MYAVLFDCGHFKAQYELKPISSGKFTSTTCFLDTPFLFGKDAATVPRQPKVKQSILLQVLVKDTLQTEAKQNTKKAKLRELQKKNITERNRAVGTTEPSQSTDTETWIIVCWLLNIHSCLLVPHSEVSEPVIFSLLQRKQKDTLNNQRTESVWNPWPMSKKSVIKNRCVRVKEMASGA